jgi:hypothetical protein
LVDGSHALPPHRKEIQARFIGETLRYASETYNVRFEGQHFTDMNLASTALKVHDAFFLSHGLKIQDDYPDWAHRRPLEVLRPYALGFDHPDSPEKTTLAGAIALRYMAGKIEVFSEAGDFNPSSPRDLRRFQRALEAPKAYARKMLAVSALEGFEAEDPDVTSRENMREQTDQILGRVDRTGRLRHYNDLLTQLDAEYDTVLDHAALTGDVAQYESWLKDNYLPACALAMQLAGGYLDHTDKVTLAHPDIRFWTYGIDPGDVYNSEFALQNSASEPLPGEIALGNGGQIATEEISDTILYGMASDEVDAFLDTVYGQPGLNN